MQTQGRGKGREHEALFAGGKRTGIFWRQGIDSLVDC